MKWFFLILCCCLAFNLSSYPIFEYDDLEIEELEDEIVQEEDLADFEKISTQMEEESLEEEENSTPTVAIQSSDISQATPLESFKTSVETASQAIQVNFRAVFLGSPIIYILLSALSIASICIWLYSMLTVRSIELLPPDLIKDLRSKFIHNQYNEALDTCMRQKHFFCKMLASGILVRKHGLGMMVDTMKAEGKRSTITFWQRIGLLNDIALIAPMLGLLGTVMGMFYAFYDLNRSIESVSVLFDGLGVSVGTTVAGLIVAIIAMILHTTAKYRLVRVLTNIDNEAQTFAALIDTRAPNYLEGLK